MTSTMQIFWMAPALGMGVGAILGITGAGGGIFAVPALIFGLGWAVPQAGPVALFAVGAGAAVGAAAGLRAGLVRYRAAMAMAVAGVAVAPLGTYVAHRVPEHWLVSLFAVLMVWVALRMLHGARAGGAPAATASNAFDAPSAPVCAMNPSTGRLRWTAASAATLACIGACSGFASGLLGVGGGFVIVPALRRFSDVPLHGIVATSLLVIALIATGTVTSAWLHGVRLDLEGGWFIGGTVAGMVLGRAVSRHLTPVLLQRTFAMLMMAVAAGLLIKAWL